MTEIPQEALHLFEGEHLAFVATLMPDGSPQVSPVWVAEEDGLVVINSAEGRLKTDNLRRDGRAAISIANATNPQESILVRGRVIEITHEGADESIDELSDRYFGLPDYPARQPGEQRVLIRIEPDRVTHNAYERGPEARPYLGGALSGSET
jgi:PPOX class probable F420-dependent enzyme